MLYMGPMPQRIDSAPWDLDRVHYAGLGRLRYVQLVASATWDVCRLSWLLLLWNLRCLRYMRPLSFPLRETLVAVVT